MKIKMSKRLISGKRLSFERFRRNCKLSLSWKLRHNEDLDQKMARIIGLLMNRSLKAVLHEWMIACKHLQKLKKVKGKVLGLVMNKSKRMLFDEWLGACKHKKRMIKLENQIICRYQRMQSSR